MPDQTPSDPLEALIARSAAGQPDFQTENEPIGNINAPEDVASMPSSASMLGSFLGMVSPELAIPGAALGSAAKQLATSVPALVKAGFGPMSSEGVGDEMLNTARNIGLDTVKSGLLNEIPGVAKYLAGKTGTGLAKIGASEAANMPMQYRAAVGPVMKLLGVPTGVSGAAEVASMAGPAAARVVAPIATAASEAIPADTTVVEGLKRAALGAASKFGAEPEAPESMPTTGRAYGPPNNPNPPEPPPFSANTAAPGTPQINGQQIPESWKPFIKGEVGTSPNSTPPPADLGPSLAGLHDAVTQSLMSPMDKFYANNPMGSGRTTGSWPVEPGQGGLADVTAGRIGPRTVPEAEAITFGKPNVVGGPEPPILDSGFTQGQLPGEIPDLTHSTATDTTEFPAEEAPVDLDKELQAIANLSARRYNTTAPSGLPLRP